ncbi:cupin domain-containing protein [Arcicella sp. DC2W]|uniref:Cupin domain-containing protein n=1 Tax=Arcicella gelida TaxID=2984195 RepID=A0ABU5S4E2_9BACT|nr:cupin domain-containing protein [Arcicella sp. DC2W]MEA5403292.1 cupin domain-containing protein [Arcicella sp. DC2W]
MVVWTVSVIAGYFIGGLVIHYWIFPIKTPDLTDYFKVGQSFHSKLEGLTQTIVKVENGLLTTDITIQAQSNGPVPHVHENFEETFVVKSGTLSMLYGSDIKRFTTGQTIVIPKDTPHKPFNETDSVVVVTSVMPLDFAFCLSQIYPFWDENEANSKPPKVLFQLAVLGNKFDSYPTADAPPKAVLKTLKFLLAPTARLIGYKNYNEDYRPK